MFLNFEKKRKNLRIISQATYHTAFRIIYRKSVPVNHQHETSCSEMRTRETMQLRTACDKRL